VEKDDSSSAEEVVTVYYALRLLYREKYRENETSKPFSSWHHHWQCISIVYVEYYQLERSWLLNAFFFFFFFRRLLCNLNLLIIRVDQALLKQTVNDYSTPIRINLRL
jgi:hypothetical protein